MKYLKGAAVLWFVSGFVSIAFATTVTVAPSSDTPGGTFTYTFSDLSNDTSLYLNEGTAPLAWGNPDNTSGNLSSFTTWVSGSFDNTVEGTYDLIATNNMHCEAGVSFADCIAANNDPSWDATFVISSGPPPPPPALTDFEHAFGSATTTASTTALAFVDIPTFDYFMLYVVFMSAMVFVMWVFRKR